MHLCVDAQTGGADPELQVRWVPPSVDLHGQAVGGCGANRLGEPSARSSADPARGSGTPTSIPHSLSTHHF